MRGATRTPGCSSCPSGYELRMAQIAEVVKRIARVQRAAGGAGRARASRCFGSVFRAVSMDGLRRGGECGMILAAVAQGARKMLRNERVRVFGIQLGGWRQGERATHPTRASELLPPSAALPGP